MIGWQEKNVSEIIKSKNKLLASIFCIKNIVIYLPLLIINKGFFTLLAISQQYTYKLITKFYNNKHMETADLLCKKLRERTCIGRRISI
jgi:hypothetical protein